MEYSFLFKGQLPSGKNAVMITRTGHRYPKKRFLEWRNSIFKTLNFKGTKIETPVSVELNYYTGDKRRRDVPGLLDAVWHALEKYGVASDDCLFGGLGEYVLFNHYYDKNNPRCEIKIKVNDAGNTKNVCKKTIKKSRGSTPKKCRSGKTPVD